MQDSGLVIPNECEESQSNRAMYVFVGLRFLILFGMTLLLASTQISRAEHGGCLLLLLVIALVVLDAFLHVLDEGVAGQGGTGDDIHLGFGSFLDVHAIP